MKNLYINRRSTTQFIRILKFIQRWSHINNLQQNDTILAIDISLNLTKKVKKLSETYIEFALYAIINVLKFLFKGDSI